MKSSPPTRWEEPRGRELESEPARWSDHAIDASTAEGAAGLALSRARMATLPTEEEERRLARAVREPARATVAASNHRRWRWRLAVAVALMFAATAGAVGAAGAIWRLARRASAAAEQPVRGAAVAMRAAAQRVPERTRAQGRSSFDQEAAFDESGAAPVLAPSAPPARSAPSDGARSRTAREGSAPVATAPPRSPAPLSAREMRPLLAGEARLVTSAFHALRTDRDPAAALRFLERYERAFPRGALRDEARIARVEALIVLGRRAEASRLLAGMGDGDGTFTRNIQVARGELLAETGRCAEGARDFDRILSSPERDDAAARALYGRASCRLLGGEIAAGQQDLRRYLALDPEGPFAAAAREALRSAP